MHTKQSLNLFLLIRFKQLLKAAKKGGQFGSMFQPGSLPPLISGGGSTTTITGEDSLLSIAESFGTKMGLEDEPASHMQPTAQPGPALATGISSWDSGYRAKQQPQQLQPRRGKWWERGGSGDEVGDGSHDSDADDKTAAAGGARGGSARGVRISADAKEKEVKQGRQRGSKTEEFFIRSIAVQTDPPASSSFFSHNNPYAGVLQFSPRYSDNVGGSAVEGGGQKWSSVPNYYLANVIGDGASLEHSVETAPPYLGSALDMDEASKQQLQQQDQRGRLKSGGGSRGSARNKADGGPSYQIPYSNQSIQSAPPTEADVDGKSGKALNLNSYNRNNSKRKFVKPTRPSGQPMLRSSVGANRYASKSSNNQESVVGGGYDHRNGRMSPSSMGITSFKAPQSERVHVPPNASSILSTVSLRSSRDDLSVQTHKSLRTNSNSNSKSNLNIDLASRGGLSSHNAPPSFSSLNSDLDSLSLSGKSAGMVGSVGGGLSVSHSKARIVQGSGRSKSSLSTDVNTVKAAGAIVGEGGAGGTEGNLNLPPVDNGGGEGTVASSGGSANVESGGGADVGSRGGSGSGGGDVVSPDLSASVGAEMNNRPTSRIEVPFTKSE